MEIAILLSAAGIAIMTGGAFVASTLGVTITGNAVVGAMKKNPEPFGLYLGLSALPSSQGLYGFVGYIMTSKYLTESVSMLQACAVLTLGIMMGVACIYSAIRQAQVCANGITAISAGHNVFVPTMVMGVFPELYAILSLLVVLLVSFAI
ncbi:MAG: ATPase [Tannerellaceae bacterium]|jgi:V/A-type H+-transporting ATPase subunit K|nr:ATPase [Tannerellaceae bacterium]